MNVKLKSALVISILVLAGFVLLWNFGSENVNVQGAPLYVGSDSNYKTIQDAVDNAVSGDTIYVKNDTYYESVTINTNDIDLIGNSTTDCKIMYYYNGSSTSDFAAGINITADDVTVSGFNISVSGNYTYGIHAYNSYNIIVDNNNISTTGPNNGDGIYFNAIWDSKIENNNITTSGYYSHGIHFYGPVCSNNDIINNNITILETNSIGIQFWSGPNKNTISGNTLNIFEYSAYGINMNLGCENNDFIDNTITTFGDYGYGIVLGQCNKNNFTDNTIDTFGPDARGIHLSFSDQNNLTDNTITTMNDSAYAISLSSSSDCRIITNTINVSGPNAFGIWTDKSSFNNIIGNEVNTSGNSGYGIYLKGISKNNNVTDNTVDINEDYGIGIYIWQSFRNNITFNTINATVLYGFGIFIQDSIENNVTGNFINTTGVNGYGIGLESSANNNDIVDNTINTSGVDSYGIYLDQSNDNYINDNKINTTGDGGDGIYFNGAACTNNDIINNNITTFESYTHGINFRSGPNKNTLFGNTFNIYGLGAIGILISMGSDENEIINNTITTYYNKYTFGIYLGQSDDNNVTLNTIRTYGDDGYGFVIEDSNYNNIITNTVNTSGNSGFGMFLDVSANNNDIVDNTIKTTGTMGYGIYIHDNSNNNNITDNKINTSGLNGYGIRVRESANNTIINNFVNTSGINGISLYLEQSSNVELIDNTINTLGDLGSGIYLDDYANNNTITDNTINTSGQTAPGIYLYQNIKYNDLIGNTINTIGQWGFGIYLQTWCHNNDLIGNTINTSGLAANAINIQESLNTNLADNTIYTSGPSSHGISLVTNSNNTAILNCNFTVLGSNSYGIFLDGYIANAVDSIFSSMSDDDIHIRKNSNFTVINCTFSDLDATIDSGGVLQVKNYLDIQTYYDGGVTPILGADVVVEDNSVSVYSSTGYGGTDAQTDASGRVEDLTITDRWYLYRNSATENVTNVKVKKTVDATWEESRDVNMSTSHTEVFIATDISAPIVPLNLNATSVLGGDAINVTWNVSTDDTVNYELWWKDPDTGIWVKITNITQPTNWYVWAPNSLVNGSKYYFRLRAWDEMDLASEFTETFEVVHWDHLAPSAPTNLAADTLTENSIQLTWGLSGDTDLAGSWVYMNVTGSGIIGPYYRIAVVNLSASGYIVTGLAENETYYFLIKCVDEANNTSPGSNIAQNTTLNIPPLKPILDSLPPLTNNPKLNVTGTTEPDINVEIYNNGDLAGSGSANITGAFKIEITLEESQNAITAKAIDNANNPSGFTSPAIDVILDTVAPIVSLDVFVDYTKNPTLDVTGSTENNSIVYIYNNDNLAAIGNANITGKFDIQITLVENENMIHANALDPAKNNGSNSTAQRIILDLKNPVADAGADLNITVGDTVNFDGTGSTDNWGIVNYTWNFTYDDISIKLYGEKPTFKFDIVGTNVVTLTLTDVVGNIGTDTLTVTVSSVELPDTEPPIADAGPDQTVDAGTTVTFDGSGSTDNDAISSYNWTFSYDENLITLNGVISTYKFDIPGDYLVTLTVFDFATPQNSGIDTLWVNVTAIVDNDVDDDGMDDVWETDNGLDPTDPSDATGDPDNDDLTNLEEFQEDTDPNDSDTDNDGLPDGWEVDNDLDPLDDGTTDVINGPEGDPDDDGFSNLDEYNKGTDPRDSASKPEKKDDEDNMMLYLIIIIIIIVIIVLLAVAMSRRKPTEDELLAAEEEELAADTELEGMEDKGLDEKAAEDKSEKESESAEDEGGFECPTCGASLAKGDTVCPECGEQFDDED